MYPDEIDDFMQLLSDVADELATLMVQAPEPDYRGRRDYNRRKWGQQRQAHQVKAGCNRRDVRPQYHRFLGQARNGNVLVQRG